MTSFSFTFNYLPCAIYVSSTKILYNVKLKSETQYKVCSGFTLQYLHKIIFVKWIGQDSSFLNIYFKSLPFPPL